MALKSTWYPVFIAACCWLSGATGQENAMPRLPDSLLECYNASGLYNKENLLPMTITTLLDIVRKVETSEDGRNMNLLALTTSILHRFKMDGIERNPNVPDQDGVIPYTVSGTQFYKHRLLLIMLIPQNNYRFPNNTLTPVERCTLHFMLSKSVEHYQRGDEATTCSRLATASSQLSRRRRAASEDVPAAPAEPAAAGDVAALPAEDDGSGAVDGELTTEGAITAAVETSATAAAETSATAAAETSATAAAAETTATAASEVELVKQVDETEKKGNMFLDPNENLRLYGRPASGRYLDDIDREESETIQEESAGAAAVEHVSYSPRALFSVALSDCPVENGVMMTASGAVSVASVLAGIAAGLEPQTVPLANLAAASTRSNALVEAASTSAAAVDNRWAATLAGDLAEVTLYEGPLGTMRAGAAGGWNDTQIPRWYFLQDASRRYSHLTDTEIRGGIDGLTLASNIQTWNQQAPELRLSEVLEMYYSETGLFQTRFRSCQRKDNFVGVAPSAEMAQQTSSFAVVLDPQSISPARLSFSAIRNYSQIASNQLTTYVPSGLVDQACRTAQDGNTAVSPNMAVDLLVVLDSGWDYSYVTRLLATLMDRLQVNPYFSNITIIAGQQPQLLLNSTSRQTDFFTNFTSNAYGNLTRGMNLRVLLGTTLMQHFQNKLEDERRGNVAGGRATAVLFVPAQGFSVSDDDLQACIASYSWFRTRLPDVKFFYLVAGNGDRYRSLVDDGSRDIFTLTTGQTAIESTVAPIVARFTSLHQRVVNPNCGSDWTERSYSSVQFAAAMDPFTVSYYRLHPNYFVTATAGVLRVQGSPSGALRVCWSRSVEFPNNASAGSNSVSCQLIGSNAYEVPLVSACDGYSVSQCPPLYLSVESTSDSTSFTCSDRTVCRSVRSLRYFLSHEGLGCRAGVGQIVASSLLTCIAAISVALARTWFESST
ncbi:uncharacterized protein LOC134529535 [Bacillus rossius redtenbacheri]|uniref:uncharacterized protein LOC134529535 n=1 Tax=Bacillus rossius redtenbacheri TaxID=93214 RepID=UPI002FDE61E5